MNTNEQRQLIDEILRERLGEIVPEVLRCSLADCWIVACKEYHEDLVFPVLVPGDYMNARRVTMLVFIKKNERIRRFSLSMPDKSLERFYSPYWKFGEEEQLEALERLLEEYDPEKISLNISPDYKYADGLSTGLLETLKTKLKKRYVKRFMCDPLIPIQIMETRTPKEEAFAPELLNMAFEIIDETYSLASIKPGVTTCHDLAYSMMDKVKDRGLDYWFTPTIDLQREGIDHVIYEGVIEEGDLLHCDFGIRFAHMCTDTQRLAYVAKKGEKEVPAWMKEGMKINNRFQDIVRKNFSLGRTGNEVLSLSLAKAKEQHIDACLYSHPTNLYGHGPGPTIGLWNNQNTVPLDGELAMREHAIFALELNTKYEYQGISYTFFTEETVLYKDKKVTFLHDGRDQITCIH